MINNNSFCPIHKCLFIYTDINGKRCCDECIKEKELMWVDLFCKQWDHARQMRYEIMFLKNELKKEGIVIR